MKMIQNTKWAGMGVLSVLLIGAVATGCSNQNRSLDNGTGTPATPINKTAPLPQTNSSGNTTGNNRGDDNGPGNHMPGSNTPGNNMPGTNRPDVAMDFIADLFCCKLFA